MDSRGSPRVVKLVSGFPINVGSLLFPPHCPGSSYLLNLDTLNRVIEGITGLDKDKDDRRVEAAARHVAKYIFPLQHGLHNVFSCTLNYWENGGRFRDYGERDEEIQVFERG